MKRRIGLILVFIIFLFLVSCDKKESPEYPDLFGEIEHTQLQSGGYQAIYLTMDLQDGFSEEYFSTYRGLQTAICDIPLVDLRQLAQGTVLLAAPNLQTVYLHVDTRKLALEDYDKQLAALEKAMSKYKELTFEVLLEHPQITWFTEGLAGEDYFENVAKLGKVVTAKSNGVLHYMGAREWLICNPGNYAEGSTDRVNGGLAKKLFLYNICDRSFQVDGESLQTELRTLRTLVEKYQGIELSGDPDEENYYIFLGDSIFAYDYGSTSLPEAFLSLSGSVGSNCSQGGSTMAQTGTKWLSLSEMESGVRCALDLKEPLDAYLEQLPEEFWEFRQGLTRLRADVEAGVLANRKLKVVIQYGFNDYFMGLPLGNVGVRKADTFLGAMEDSIPKLQSMGAEIILLVPGYCHLYEQGTLVNSEDGATLEEYRQAVEAYARANDLRCISLLDLLDVNGENQAYYLADQVHPGPQARFEMAMRLAGTL